MKKFSIEVIITTINTKKLLLAHGSSLSCYLIVFMIILTY